MSPWAHRRIQRLVMSAVDGEAADERVRKRVDAHLERCRPCRDMARFVGAAKAVLVGRADLGRPQHSATAN